MQSVIPIRVTDEALDLLAMELIERGVRKHLVERLHGAYDVSKRRILLGDVFAVVVHPLMFCEKSRHDLVRDHETTVEPRTSLLFR